MGTFIFDPEVERSEKHYGIEFSTAIVTSEGHPKHKIRNFVKRVLENKKTYNRSPTQACETSKLIYSSDLKQFLIFFGTFV